MNENSSSRDAYTRLRLQAQALLKEEKGGSRAPQGNDLIKILNDLEVHQIELDLQNEELRQTAAYLATARDE